MSAKILILDSDPATQRVAAYALGDQGFRVATAGDGARALDAIAAERPDLVVVDSRLSPADGFDVVRRIRAAATGGHLPILMLTAAEASDGRVLSLRAGADDSLSRPFHPDALQARIRSLLIRHPQARPSSGQGRPGKVLAFYGAKGGVGTTTLAVNTAVALHEHLGHRVALVDAGLQWGDHRLFLDVGIDRKTIVDLVTAPAIDADLVRSVMVADETGVDLLLAPLKPEAAELVTPDHLPQILGLLQAMYEFALVDLDHRLDEVNLRVLDAADVVLIVMTADLPSLKNVRALMETAQGLGYREDKFRLVLNRSTAVTGITATRIERALNLRISAEVVNDFRRAITSLNRGRPFVLEMPDARLSKTVLSLARSLASPAPEPVAALEGASAKP